jgi:hypothetical protein
MSGKGGLALENSHRYLLAGLEFGLSGEYM